jgi:lipid-binding SYLF domain-containing protein
MMSTARRLLYALPMLLAATAASAGPREEARLLEATQVLEDTASMPDLQIPDLLLKRAQGVAVLPGVLKVGLGLGASGGRGLLTVRDAEGRWSNPVFITLGAGSFGLQWGLQTSDIILVFTTRKSIEGLSGGKVTLGADASVAAGPVGRQVSGATDFGLQAEVYSYSRSKGLYGGIAIDGTVITIDNRANAAYYQHNGVLASDIFAGRTSAGTASSKQFLGALDHVLNSAGAGHAAKPAVAVSSRAPADTQTAAPEGRGLESGGATPHPLENPPPH